MSGDTRRGPVLVAGSINTDLVVRVPRAPQAGETVTGDRFDIFGGGKGANQALAAARSGAATAMLGAVGDDDFGRQRRADLERDGVDCSGVAISSDYSSGVALITVEASGENRIAYIPGATGSVSERQARDAFNAINPGLVLMTLELPEAALLALMEAAKSAGVPTIVNATPEPSVGREIALQADVLVVNETEASELLGEVSSRGQIGDAASWLRERGPAAVIVTLGSRGAALADGSGMLHVAAPEVNVLDTTGAGDAFCGALAGQLVSGGTLAQSTKVAVAAGAVAVTKAGAQPSMPWREEIEALLKMMRRS